MNKKLKLTGNQEIKKIKEDYKIFKEEKNQIIEVLKSKSYANIFDTKNEENLLEGESLIIINFKSYDKHINHTIKCKNVTEFKDIEAKLYEKYPDYTGDLNYFMHNGNRINRYKTLADNGIPGYTIILEKLED